VGEKLPDSDCKLPSFEVDGMLGGLAKWLRILGFDAVYPSPTASGTRLFVTMKKKAVFGRVSRIQSGKPLRQLSELLEHIQIRPDPDLLLTRCLECNVLVRPVHKERVRGRVPDRISEAHQSFNECPDCGRIYWEGSHVSRIRKSLGDLWENHDRSDDHTADTI
jgi:uncharacterized protein